MPVRRVVPNWPSASWVICPSRATTFQPCRACRSTAATASASRYRRSMNRASRSSSRAASGSCSARIPMSMTRGRFVLTSVDLPTIAQVLDGERGLSVPVDDSEARSDDRAGGRRRDRSSRDSPRRHRIRDGGRIGNGRSARRDRAAGGPRGFAAGHPDHGPAGAAGDRVSPAGGAGRCPPAADRDAGNACATGSPGSSPGCASTMPSR